MWVATRKDNHSSEHEDATSMVIRKQQRLLLYLGIIVFLSLSLRSSLKNGGVAAWLPTQLQDDYFFTSSQQPRLSSSLSSSTTESATSRSTSNQTTKTTTTTTQRRDRLLPEGQSHRTSPERIIRGLSIAENNNNDNDAKDDATTTDDDGDDDHNNTNTTSNRRPSEQQPPLTIIVALSGEMGNNLGKLAHGICLEEWLRDDFGVGRTQLVLRHQAHPKWKRGQAALQRCFPWTRTLQFAAGNTPSLDAWDAIRPADWPTWFRNMRQVNTFDIANITQALQYTVDLYRQQQQQSQQGDANDRQSTLVPDHLPLPRVLSMNDGDNNNNNRRKRRRRASISNDKGNMNTTINVSLPFIWANKFAIWDVCVDRYYDKLRDVYFAFDEEACCGEARPYPDEAVFHFRNFLGEMVRVGKKLGFEEINPHDMANTMFAHLEPGSRLAITTRAGDVSAAQPYVNALAAARNVTTRVFTSHTDVHDFCFLKQSRRELVGSAVSTFVAWAALLGNATTVRMYRIDSDATRQAKRSKEMSYNWTHPALSRRVFFEEYAQ